MNPRNLLTGLLVVIAFAAGVYWQKTMTPPPSPEPAAGSAPQAMPPSGSSAPQVSTDTPTDAGLAWDVPKRWTPAPERAMRLATYTVPATGGGDAGECAVFYFGPSQGGDADANIERWVGQFEHAGKVTRESRTIHGFTVKLVGVTGEYLAPSGPMMQSSGTKKGWMLKGAIVAGPQGNVFFKFVGPEPLVRASSREFDGMLETLRKS